MKKTVLILAITLVLASILTLSASSTEPERVKVLIPLSSVKDNEDTFEYDVSYQWLMGHVVQPLAVPEPEVHGAFGR